MGNNCAPRIKKPQVFCNLNEILERLSVKLQVKVVVRGVVQGVEGPKPIIRLTPRPTTVRNGRNLV